MFVADGASRRVSARIQLFAELAYAQHMIGQPPGEEVDAWLSWSGFEEEYGRESVLLACGLDTRTAEALTALALAEGAEPELLSLVVGEAIREGARLGAATQAHLVAALIDGADLDVRLRLERARILVSLPIDPEQQPAALGFLDRLPPGRRVLMRALAAAGWRRPDAETRTDLMAVLGVDPDRLEEPPGSSVGFFDGMGPDRDYERAVAAVTVRLLTSDEGEVAERLARLRSGLSFAASTRVRRALGRSGFDSLIERFKARRDADARGPDWPPLFEETDEADQVLLEAIAALAPAEQLGVLERRRLDDLVALVNFSGFASAPASEASAGVCADTDRLRVALRVAAQRGGIVLSSLAAEAQEMLAVMAQEQDDRLGPLFMLADAPRPLVLGRWDRVDDILATAEGIADATRSRYPWIGDLAMCCLSDLPEPGRTAAMAALRSGLGSEPDPVRARAARALLLLGDQPRMARELAGQPDPALRGAAARWWVTQHPSTPQTAALVMRCTTSPSWSASARPAGSRRSVAVAVLGDVLASAAS